MRLNTVAALLLAAAVNLAAAAAPPPIADFFENPEFSGAQLSPSGKYLAVRVGAKDKRDRLAVVTLADNTVQVVGNFSDADIGDFEWVNDERLVFNATDRSVGQGDMRYAPGLYAINRDGSKFRPLVSRSGQPFITVGTGGLGAARDLLPWNTYLLGQRGGQNSEFIYVVYAAYSRGQLDYIDLQRLNTQTGQYTSFKRPGDSMAWLLDNNGEPRLTTTVEKGVSTLYYRDPARNQEWRALTSYNTYTGGHDAFSPLAFGPDGTLYVVSQAHKDKSALYAYNLATGKMAEQPLVALDGYDFSGRPIMNQDKLLGFRHLTDAQGTTWIDAGMKAMQEKVDTMLPNTINILTPPTRPASPWVLVLAYSDLFPARTMLYNSDTKLMTLIGASHPNIQAQQMASQQLVHYKARDGLDIPAWLTLPRGGGKNGPMVVLVHGGPYVRGKSWGWDAQVQFLASRGYAVLEPEFRGSTGFGARHFRAGWKQWGLKMQDDIADGTRWAVAQGYADARRVCIAGASYGGYATLMGLVNDADLYQCGIDWAGVTDINLLYDGHWNFTSDLPDGWKQYGMPALVGDQVQDAEQLKATSPLLQAARIKQPLLLAYGGADQRVPLPHGTKFYNAVKQGNPNVEWIEYPEEGHGWELPRNRIDFWGRVEKFLNKHIGEKR